MARVALSRLAATDLEAIFEYSLREFGSEVALAYVDALRNAIALLTRHPRAGIQHDRIDPPIFSLPCRSHRIYYDWDGDRVTVQRILHKAMDPNRWLP